MRFPWEPGIGLILAPVIAATADHACSEVPATQPMAQKENVKATLKVILLGPIGTLTGHTWAVGDDGRPLLSTGVRGANEVEIRLPSGRRVSLRSRLTFFTQEHGAVVEVTLTPDIDLQGFKASVALLQTILKEWRIEPGEQMAERLGKWAKHDWDATPFQTPVSASTPIDDNALLYAEIRPHTSGKGWYVSVIIAATPEATRRLWDPTTRPADDKASRDSKK